MTRRVFKKRPRFRDYVRNFPESKEEEFSESRKRDSGLQVSRKKESSDVEDPLEKWPYISTLGRLQKKWLYAPLSSENSNSRGATYLCVCVCVCSRLLFIRLFCVLIHKVQTFRSNYVVATAPREGIRWKTGNGLSGVPKRR